MQRVLWIALGLLGCGHPSPAPAPPPAPVAPTAPWPADAALDAPLDQDLAALAARATKLYQDVVAVFAAAGENCPAAASQLAVLQTTYADVVRANAKVLHEGRAKELRVALQPHSDALDAAAKSIVESKTMARCSSDRAFTDAFDNLVGAPP